MGFLSNIVSGTIKLATTPIAVVKDVVEVITDGEPENTKEHLESALEDYEDAVDDLTD